MEVGEYRQMVRLRRSVCKDVGSAQGRPRGATCWTEGDGRQEREVKGEQSEIEHLSSGWIEIPDTKE